MIHDDDDDDDDEVAFDHLCLIHDRLGEPVVLWSHFGCSFSASLTPLAFCFYLALCVLLSNLTAPQEPNLR